MIWAVFWFSYNEDGNLQTEKIYSCDNEQEAIKKYKEYTKNKKYGWGAVKRIN